MPTSISSLEGWGEEVHWALLPAFAETMNQACQHPWQGDEVGYVLANLEAQTQLNVVHNVSGWGANNILALRHWLAFIYQALLNTPSFITRRLCSLIKHAALCKFSTWLRQPLCPPRRGFGNRLVSTQSWWSNLGAESCGQFRGDDGLGEGHF